MLKRLLLAFGVAVGVAAVGCTAVAVVGIVAVGTVAASLVFGVLALALQDTAVQLGPESDTWPVQETDAAAMSLLTLGRQTEFRRTTLNIEATGDYVDHFFGLENVRVQFQWRKPNVLRIDV